MIIVDYPDNTCRRFFIHEGMAFGPFDSNGDIRAVEVNLDLNTSMLQSEKGIHGENSVTHSSFAGKVYYYPILADCAPIPSVETPRSIRIPCLESPYYKDAQYGFGCPDLGALVLKSATYYVHHAVQYNSTTKYWTLVKLMARKVSPRTCYVYQWVFKVNRVISATQVELIDTYWYSVYDVDPLFDLTQPASCLQIMDVTKRVSRWVKYSPGMETKPAFTTDPSASLSPSKLQQNLEIFADNLMQEEFPLRLANYGDLASAAVKSKRLNNTNMIEFLKDLRDVKALIPKLENLTSLKGAAGTYLSVKYGILPTKSDLESIVGAFKARKPFLDREGNTVFNAAYATTQVINGSIYKLEQHIKVPVANEDSEFVRLLDDLDSSGFGLTLENVWDLVKYSFAIDWFINVGGLLRRVDNNLRLLRYNIPYVTMSDKRSIFGVLPQKPTLSTLGQIEWRYYHRWVDSQCPLPPLSLSLSPTVSKHWLEAGALLVQRS